MKKGYTLLELLVVIGMTGILLSIGGLSFANIRIRSQIDLIAAEVRAELMRAQSSSLNNKSGGIYFEYNKYTYFYTPTFNPTDPENDVINLPNSVTLSSITVESGGINTDIAIFEPLTGYLLGWSDPAQIVVTDTRSGQSRTVSINRWGVIEIN